MMKTLKKLNQIFYKANYTYTKVKDENGDYTGEIKKTFGTPIKYEASISTTAGTPEEINAGIVLNYDRYITIFHHEIILQEGDLLYVDVATTSKPDYVVVKSIKTQTGEVDRYGIKKIVE